MKKILTSIVLSAAIMLMGCGCTKENNGAETRTTTQITTITTAPKITTTETTTTAAETTTTAATTTAAATTTEAEPEDDTIVVGIGAEIEITGAGLIYEAKTGDGFISFSKEDISESLSSAGIGEKELSSYQVKLDAEVSDKNKNLYKFAMINAEGVKGYKGSEETIYIKNLILDGDSYIVFFGSDEKAELEDIAPYCTAGKLVEYWAFAGVSDNGQIVLIPFIAGTETNGYYLVIPTLEMIGADISGMYLPEAVGDDYNLSDIVETTEPDVTEAPKSENVAPEQEMGKILLNITSVENDAELTCVNCNVTNTCDFPLILTGKAISINGKDCSDKLTACFILEAGETIEDYFFLDYTQLYIGDELDIVLTATRYDEFEDLGDLRFEMTLK